MKIAYVFFNGELEGSIDYYKELLVKEKGDIYCADGGAFHLDRLGIYPLEIWGDLDSVSEEILNKYRTNNIVIKKFPRDKDFTDGELVLQYLVDKNYDEIRIIGGLGGRVDHALTNLNLIFKFKNILFLTEKERIFSIEKRKILKGFKKKTVSFVPFSEKVEGLTLKGFKYPLDNYILHQGDSICMSNIVTDDICEINFNSGKLMGIILNEEI